jgi:hypothetical protein
VAGVSAGWVDLLSLLRRRFINEWAGNTRVVEPNAEADPDADRDDDVPEAWVRFSVLLGAARAANVGGPKVRQRDEGEVIVEVFTKAGDGDGKNTTLCDRVAEIFRGFEADGLVFWMPRLVVVGTVRSHWYQQNVICAFQDDRVYTING